MKTLFFILLILSFRGKAQTANCTFKPPIITIDFGSGYTGDLNTDAIHAYTQVMRSCPSDGHYAYAASMSDCFSGDWHTIEGDHTPGDVAGNMMIVNASYRYGEFLRTPVSGLEPGKMYEFGVWMMNVCRITEKCPFPLLPEITIRLETPGGKVVAQFNTGQVPRRETPVWTQYRVMFTAPAETGTLLLTMIDEVPGGCGNDFVLDDITFRECVKTPPVVRKPTTTSNKPVTKPVAPPAKNAVVPNKSVTVAKNTLVKKTDVAKTVAPGTTSRPSTNKPTTSSPVTNKPVAGKPANKTPITANAKPVNKPAVDNKIDNPVTRTDNPVTKLPASGRPLVAKADTPVSTSNGTIAAPPVTVIPPPPAAITRRENEVYKRIELPPGEIRISLYDNGEIDGDTVTVYHNNRLVISKARLSAQPLSMKITVDASQPHHELIMVANNLGSIPPNTSLMVVTAGDKRYEVFISSNEQKNAKVIFDLKR